MDIFAAAATDTYPVKLTMFGNVPHSKVSYSAG